MKHSVLATVLVVATLFAGGRSPSLSAQAATTAPPPLHTRTSGSPAQPLSGSSLAALADPTGGSVRDVDLPDGRAVSMSPNGQLLAAVRPSKSLCIYRVETMEQVSCADVTELNSGIRVDDIVWSPDSTRLAFGENSFLYLRDGDLWVMDAQTGQLIDLTDDGYDGKVVLIDDSAENTSYYLDVSPAWTPDGRFITFSRSSFIGRQRLGNTVAQVPASGGEVETLATVSADIIGVYYYRAAWSPDGASFYYSVDFPTTNHPDNGIWVYDKASGQTRLLAVSDDAELGPLVLREVSPAGDRLLAYYPSALAQFGYVNRSVLRFVDPATGALSPVPDPGPESEIFEGSWVATFSPDGQYFLQAHGISGNSRDFWVTNLATGVSTEVASDLDAAVPIEYALGPVWGANGLVFVARSVVGAYFFPIEGAGIAGAPGATPLPVAGSPVSGTAAFAVGSEPQTNGATPIFAAPDANAIVVGFLAPDHVVQVLAAPIENSQGVWYPIFDPDSQLIGYVQASRLQEVA